MKSNYILEPLDNNKKLEYDADALVYIDDGHLQYGDDVQETILNDIKNDNLQLYHGTYRYNDFTSETTIYLFGRGKESGKVTLKIQNFYPYFYQKSHSGEFKDKDGNRSEKMVVKSYPKRVADIRKRYERKGNIEYLPMEADVIFVERFRIDMYNYFKSDNEIPPKVCYFDIETTELEGGDIISISYSINGDDIKHINLRDYEDKEKGFSKFFGDVKDCDIFTAWNVEFDEEYIKDHFSDLEDAWEKIIVPFEKENKESIPKSELKGKLSFDYNVLRPSEVKKYLPLFINAGLLQEENGQVIRTKYEFNWSQYLFVDLLSMSRKMWRQDMSSWSLDNAAEEIVGKKKIDLGDKLPHELDNDTLKKYNNRDVDLLVKIENKLGPISYHSYMSWNNQLNFIDTFSHFRMNDYVLLRECHEAGIVLPSKFHTDRRDYQAAEPKAKPGFYEDIHVYDVKSMYATIAIALNASPVTKDEDGSIVARNGVAFNDRDNIFIKALQSFLDQRQVIKDRLEEIDEGDADYFKLDKIQTALKDQAASFYGMYGYANSRCTDADIAEAITSTAREIINFIASCAEKRDYDPIYFHTDSCFVVADKSKKNELLDYFNRRLKELASVRNWQSVPYLDYKGFYPKGYIHSKARNALMDEDGNIETTGMPTIRSETPQWIKDKINTLIRMMLLDKSEEECIQYLRDEVMTLDEEEPQRLGISAPLNKPVSKYKSNSYHIVALKNSDIEVNVGDRFYVLPIKNGNVKDIAFKDNDFPDRFDIDYKSYLDRRFWNKIAPFFDCDVKILKKKVFDKSLYSFSDKK